MLQNYQKITLMIPFIVTFLNIPHAALHPIEWIRFVFDSAILCDASIKSQIKSKSVIHARFTNINNI